MQWSTPIYSLCKLQNCHNDNPLNTGSNWWFFQSSLICHWFINSYKQECPSRPLLASYYFRMKGCMWNWKYGVLIYEACLPSSFLPDLFYCLLSFLCLSSFFSFLKMPCCHLQHCSDLPIWDGCDKCYWPLCWRVSTHCFFLICIGTPLIFDMIWGSQTPITRYKDQIYQEANI